MNEPDSLLLERGNGTFVRKDSVIFERFSYYIRFSDLWFEDGTATTTLQPIHPSKPFFQFLSVRIFKKQGLGEKIKTHSRIRIEDE